MLLPSDDALLKACHVAMAAAKKPLSQQLLSLQETVDMLLPPEGGHMMDGGAVAKVGNVKVGIIGGMAEEDGVDVGHPGVAEREGVELGVAEGEGIEVGMAGGEVGVAEGGADVIGENGVMVKGSFGVEVEGVLGGVGEDELGVEAPGMGEGELGMEVLSGGASPTGLTQGEDRIAVNVDFPCGPPLHSALGEEPDLDATLLQADEEELASSSSNPNLMNSNPNLLDSSHDAISDVDGSGSLPQETSSGMPVLDRNAEEGVARSHSKVIPLPMQNHCPPVNGTRTPDSTPSSSVGGSIGQLSLNREVGSTIFGSADVSKAAGHTHSPARRSWQSEGPDKAGDDVIAVPMIVRSTSTG